MKPFVAALLLLAALLLAAPASAVPTCPPAPPAGDPVSQNVYRAHELACFNATFAEATVAEQDPMEKLVWPTVQDYFVATRDAVCRIVFHPHEPEPCMAVLLDDRTGLVRSTLRMLDEP